MIIIHISMKNKSAEVSVTEFQNTDYSSEVIGNCYFIVLVLTSGVNGY